jgi:dATP pyrophosphohydrolase
MRAPFQTLIIPFRKFNNELQYCILKRSDDKYWQWISGGGEGDETPYQTAIRETFEETGLLMEELIKLDTIASVPVAHFPYIKWDDNIFVIPEYSFAVEINCEEKVVLSHEHDEFKWVSYKEAERSLKWDSNKTALWELNERLKKGCLV